MCKLIQERDLLDCLRINSQGNNYIECVKCEDRENVKNNTPKKLINKGWSYGCSLDTRFHEFIEGVHCPQCASSDFFEEKDALWLWCE